MKFYYTEAVIRNQRESRSLEPCIELRISLAITHLIITPTRKPVYVIMIFPNHETRDFYETY